MPKNFQVVPSPVWITNKFVFMNNMAIKQFLAMAINKQIKFKFLVDLEGDHDWKVILLV